MEHGKMVSEHLTRGRGGLRSAVTVATEVTVEVAVTIEAGGVIVVILVSLFTYVVVV